jgi:hypothetical protein
MNVPIPYGLTTLQVGTLTVYSLKLRFNAASWSFIEPEITELRTLAALTAITKRNDFYTVQFQTYHNYHFKLLRDAINRGQIAQQEEILRLWKENGHRPIAKYVSREQICPTMEC